MGVSKLIIGGAVITTAIQLNTDKSLIIVIAIVLAFIVAYGGFLLLTSKKQIIMSDALLLYILLGVACLGAFLFGISPAGKRWLDRNS
ncbi:MAG: hypothetical protein LUD46_20860 [Parabacteroides sp.]|nr:hypothetical protein [Parabacteroides sp.]